MRGRNVAVAEGNLVTPDCVASLGMSVSEDIVPVAVATPVGVGVGVGVGVRVGVGVDVGS